MNVKQIEIRYSSSNMANSENQKQTPSPSISEVGYQRILSWNSKGLEEWKTCIHKVIHDQALARPNAEAICTEEDRSLSYSELDQLASRLAHHLITLGIKANTIIPLCFEKSIWNVVAMLAVMKAGFAFVPFDHAAPIQRLEALARNVEATVLLCSQQLAGHLTSVAETIVPIDGEFLHQLEDKSNNELPEVASTDIAYMIYTSGSTGEPKGTLISHGAYCSSAKFHAPAQLLNPQSRALQFASHIFDASLVEILTVLIVGGTVWYVYSYIFVVRSERFWNG